MNKFPTKMTLTFADGREVVVEFMTPRPSASGRMNAHAGTKIKGDGYRLQVGCNVTEIKGE